MTTTRKLLFAMLGLAMLSGCATSRVGDAGAEAAPAAPLPTKVSVPAKNYGSLGGYRYRRLVVVNAEASGS
jgi:hypothetical protein